MAEDRNPEREAQRARADFAWEQWQAAQRKAPSPPIPPSTPSQPGPPPAAAGAPIQKGRTDPTYAWTVALLPLVWIPFGYLLPATTAWLWAPLVVIAVALCALDRKRIKAATGIALSPTDLLLIPAYLVDRTRKVGSTPAIPIAWVAAVAAALISLNTFAAPVQFSGEFAESQIEKWVRQQGMREIEVDCPSKMVRADQTVTCTVSDRKGRTALVETSVNSGGMYRWGWAR